MLGKGGCLPDPEVAERVNACWQYSSETNYIGSSIEQHGLYLQVLLEDEQCVVPMIVRGI
jgi:hypothetical protein